MFFILGLFVELHAFEGPDGVDTLVPVVTRVGIEKALVDVCKGNREENSIEGESEIEFHRTNENQLGQRQNIAQNESKAKPPSHNFVSRLYFNPGRHLSTIFS